LSDNHVSTIVAISKNAGHIICRLCLVAHQQFQQRADKNVTSIPATYLKVTVLV
jgi:hypothetical protein